MTFMNPSMFSGLFCPVHGTPPTFIPKTPVTMDRGRNTMERNER
uniref:Uncharacterized protein n=1 Tax=Arundo donax TaxID=35708 RepID=A0A0A9CLJ4_ARUDO